MYCIVVVVVVVIIIIIIIIRHELGIDRPVSASSNSIFKGLPCRLRPFGLKFSIIFGILWLFITVFINICKVSIVPCTVFLERTDFQTNLEIVSAVGKSEVNL